MRFNVSRGTSLDTSLRSWGCRMKIVGDYDQPTLRSEIDSVYTELADMQMELDNDPIRFGPKRLNSKVADCKKLVSRCTEIEINLATLLAKILRQQRTAEAELELLMQDLLATDPEVRAGRSVRDREAIANTKMREERSFCRMVTEAGEELKAAITVVKAKKADLKDTQGRLKDQVRLIQEEIALGSQWGTAPPPGMKVSLPHDAESYTKSGKNDVEMLIDNVGSVMDEILEGSESTEVETGTMTQEQAVQVLSNGASEPELKLVENGSGPEATNDEAQSVLDSLLGEIPEEPSEDPAATKSENGISDDALSGDDLDALINGDWS